MSDVGSVWSHAGFMRAITRLSRMLDGDSRRERRFGRRVLAGRREAANQCYSRGHLVGGARGGEGGGGDGGATAAEQDVRWILPKLNETQKAQCLGH